MKLWPHLTPSRGTFGRQASAPAHFAIYSISTPLDNPFISQNLFGFWHRGNAIQCHHWPMDVISMSQRLGRWTFVFAFSLDQLNITD
jgi:hypothetical protein